jgi:predicted Zn finger-like uncharacterized protein
MASEDLIVIVCPSCSQKYRVPESRIGQRAMCKKCGQRFRIAMEAPIDEDTLFGWVMEGDPGSQSVAGSTAIFDSPVAKPQEPKAPVAKPATRKSAAGTVKAGAPVAAGGQGPRIRFDRIDEIGAYFEFPATHLLDADLRRSFPQRCACCLTRKHLLVHLLIWGDKLPGKDALKLREAEVKTVRSLSSLMSAYAEKWFDHLDPVSMLPAPFSLPFPYFVCRECGSVGAVTCHILSHDNREYCQLALSNLSLAAEFYRGNGGRGTPAYDKLVEAAREQKDNQWSSLPFAVRAKISHWFTLQDGETFKGYFADADFSRSEAGAAGLVLTDRRMVYKKYTAIREYSLANGGAVDIETGPSAAMVEITQPDKRTAILAATPVVATTLAQSLNSLRVPWAIRTVKPKAK